jgi:prephenate dehydrogenase
MAERFPVPTMPAPPVGVVGLGQLGGSLAAALAAAGRPVSGWDVDPAAREAAAARGVEITQELGGVVVLAVPLPAMDGALDGLTVDPDATVTDLGSVKGPVLASLGARFGGRYVGGHPMCGTERSGHTAVDPDLFAGARWAVCLEPGTELPRWLRVAEVAMAVGAEVVPTTAAEHDDAVAAISHVPHLLAAALAAAAADAGPLALALAAGSFAGGTRVAASDPAFVTAMVEGNAAPTAAALARVEAQLRRPWPELVAAGHAAATRSRGRRAVRVPLDRAALLALGRTGGAVTRRLAAFVEGWVPEEA